MRARALLVLATALVLGLTLVPVAEADPLTDPGGKGSPTGRHDGADRADRAEEALAAVQALVTGRAARTSGVARQQRSLTLALRDLALLRDDLPPGKRAEADRYFRRPGQITDPYIPVPLPSVTARPTSACTTGSPVRTRRPAPTATTTRSPATSGR
ncbi:hypothetical protein [Nocardioides sp. TF02-7]|uniref:hypothetical protein n=1 Tax=Nocardioides sp. TF02-7 TaxID=2917724 RepID=UPI001F055188|nr:hypothetical protein [Nocardioides sp. TF02-7]UMG91925.1 hypothetical protein MF408_18160 [Nocardioides sp. TF02-7]